MLVASARFRVQSRNTKTLHARQGLPLARADRALQNKASMPETDDAKENGVDWEGGFFKKIRGLQKNRKVFEGCKQMRKAYFLWVYFSTLVGGSGRGS